MTTQYDHPRYVKHVLARIYIVYALFIPYFGRVLLGTAYLRGGLAEGNRITSRRLLDQSQAGVYRGLDLAERLLHEMQGVVLPQHVPAPPALARGLAQGGCRAERALHRARPGWAVPRLPNSLGKDLRDPRPAG